MPVGLSFFLTLCFSLFLHVGPVSIDTALYSRLLLYIEELPEQSLGQSNRLVNYAGGGSRMLMKGINSESIF